MSATNRMTRLLSRLDRLPGRLRQVAQTLLLGSKVPFVATAKLRIEEVSPQRAIVSVRNHRRVQNHLQGVHAAAMALLAETATGFAIGMHLPDDKVPLLKTLNIHYLKRARGGLKAIAELGPEQVQELLSRERGELAVPVIVTDETGRTPVRCEITWAWVPKRGD